MTIKIRMRGKSKGGIAEVKALIKHPMESGVRMNKKTGKPYPAKYIDMVEVSVNGTKAVDAQWSGAVSANPYMAVKVKANAGDEVSVNLTDNTGDKGSSSIKLK
ncbi:thiosulfate oxidation carrier complex protein SoxZ [Thiomicrorhabdus lithotrophica]|uniref:Thiosulfate oxidation carrier complex protein SoxZ n=1 Tax=Thiomicrorhabdus lithotrophica TaxID=2949997 RepID=A0ABY8CCH7_9GAMM|nr:thiosulfate oxidation carrier complex protein SoxZ [Thiomicrorhabdus lithotrophica]WEJ63674.1 thiosulfate oxidation carrier complex protein SoxZ [Thiomicrorhabdus lithotrophica]